MKEGIFPAVRRVDNFIFLFFCVYISKTVFLWWYYSLPALNMPNKSTTRLFSSGAFSLRCRLAGSNANAGANAGSSYTNSNNAVTNTNPTVSAPLYFATQNVGA